MESKFLVMCRIYHAKTGKVLIQDKIHSQWGGWTFPGGKVESGEGFLEAAQRETLEETGLQVEKFILNGTVEWISDENTRWVVFLYTAKKYTGEVLPKTHEGTLFWQDEKSLLEHPLSSNFEAFLKVYWNEDIQEAVGHWGERLEFPKKFL